MKRAIFLGIGAVVVAAAAIPAFVSAADFPPAPPTTFYGKVPAGIGQGDTVIAIVNDGAASTVCGDGITTTDVSGIVYVVDVVADSQILGCGKAGRTVQFYFVGPRRLGTDVTAWTGPGPAPKDLTGLGPSLTPKNRLPHVAKDGVN